ncbi:hypothetical protein LRS74_20685 [Streptomyces sp. LX-29]|uniref:hypothetical protein n=1 Tax=Streptomyces sp. LX-29 TaxID=2900152 RepID=UPI00240E3A82|nr:hypothetical protein [Streptomyces sp. LX-29]WFB09183.1 hypothetical protein LRS74_20685 [Streptomyces sp. LX-29]
MATASVPLPGTARTEPAPWVRRTAHIAALTPLASGLWRVAGAFGVPLGFAPGSGLHQSEIGWGMSLYLIGLSLFAETLGLLTLGLIHRWGEVIPRWVPGLGGRRIPPLLAFIPAITGAAALTALSLTALAGGWNENMDAPDSPHGAGRTVMTLCYAPLLLWGPLLGVVAVAYLIRRRRA